MKIKTITIFYCAIIEITKIKKTDHIRCHCRSKRTGISYTVSGIGKQYKYFGKHFGTFLFRIFTVNHPKEIGHGKKEEGVLQWKNGLGCAHHTPCLVI